MHCIPSKKVSETPSGIYPEQAQRYQTNIKVKKLRKTINTSRGNTARVTILNGKRSVKEASEIDEEAMHKEARKTRERGRMKRRQRGSKLY
jgi:hypothetical protein